MKKQISIFILIICMLGFCYQVSLAQDTFSICAVDTSNYYVGSAAASCNCSEIFPQGVRLISDMHPGVGVILTQAFYLPQNQNYARTLMNLGLSPQQIIDSLVAYDYQNNPTVRQYGIVDLIGGGRTAAYTGVNCPVYRNHILGPTYSIQGNTLLGAQILDSMRSRFLNASGIQPVMLALKLMAALQGAKVIGADTRCSTLLTSSKSAFIRVATPTDSLFCDLWVGCALPGRDPIDSLQVLFNHWLDSILTIGIKSISDEVPVNPFLYQNYPNPFNPVTNIKFDLPNASGIKLAVFDILGQEVEVLINEYLKPGTYNFDWDATNYPSGTYFYKLTYNNSDVSGHIYSETKKMILLK